MALSWPAGWKQHEAKEASIWVQLDKLLNTDVISYLWAFCVWWVGLAVGMCGIVLMWVLIICDEKGHALSCQKITVQLSWVSNVCNFSNVVLDYLWLKWPSIKWPENHNLCILLLIIFNHDGHLLSDQKVIVQISVVTFACYCFNVISVLLLLIIIFDWNSHPLGEQKNHWTNIYG